MYEKRIKIFVILSALLLFLCLLRLIQMQLLPTSSVQSDIEQLKLQKGQSRQLKTVRGKILDRAGNQLAIDEPHFQMCIDYQFSSFMDDRVRQGKLSTSSQLKGCYSMVCVITAIRTCSGLDRWIEGWSK